jgi:hypothetical protein
MSVNQVFARGKGGYMQLIQTGKPAGWPGISLLKPHFLICII